MATDRDARDLRTELVEAVRAKELMAAALHDATDRANRMERQYLDIESGGVHFDLQAAREFWAESEKQAAADKQRAEDVIVELRKQVEWARKLRGRAEERRHESEADSLAMLRQRDAVRSVLAEDPPGTVHPASAATRADLTARITAIYDQEPS